MAPSDETTFLAPGHPVGEAPPAGAVEKAVRGTDGTERGRVMKAIYLDEQGEPTGEWHSAQMPEDMFASVEISGLQQPPFSLEQLVFLAEQHPVHGAALEQKTADIVGKGFEWQPLDEDNADEELRDQLDAWLENLSPDDESIHEVVMSAWDDAEVTGWGFLEVVRDPRGVARRVYHVPSHTIRAHRDGYRLVQIRNQKKVWFAKWGAEKDGKPIEVDTKTGSMTTVRDKATELFILKRKSRRSTWYGIPGYVSAIGWITLSLAARDDNLLYFQNRREPRWVIVLTNLEAGSDVEADLRRAMVVDLKQPHRNVIIPVTGKGEVTFQKLTNDSKDGSFMELQERADKAIMISHRVPAERLANSQVGPLGGNATFAASRIYKDAVVAPSQELLNRRLNRFIAAEWALAQQSQTDKRKVRKAGDDTTTEEGEPPTWEVRCIDLDLTDESNEHNLVINDFKSDLITLGEARAKLGLGPLMEKPQAAEPELDPETGEPITPTEPAEGADGEEVESELNGKLYSQLPGVSKGGDGGGTQSGSDGSPDMGGGDPSAQQGGDPALAMIDADLRQVLREARETNMRLAEIADEQS